MGRLEKETAFFEMNIKNDIIHSIKEWISFKYANNPTFSSDVKQMASTLWTQGSQNEEEAKALQVAFEKVVCIANVIAIEQDLNRLLTSPHLTDGKDIFRMVRIIEKIFKEKVPEEIKNKIIAMCL